MATKDDQKVYDESDFDVLEGLEPVRQVPGMYTRTKNPLHITQEVLDNAIDEAQNGHANKVSLTVHKDGFISVTDNGRGIPVGLHPKQGIPVVVLAFTKLHAGAKFRKGNSYARSGGLHGVGVSVTNALSHRLEVEVKREGKVHKVHFVDGDREISPVEQTGECGPRTSGTKVRFSPNAKYFDSVNLPLGELEHLLRSKAMLLPGITVSYVNEVTGDEKSWCYQEGLQAYLKERLEGFEQVGDVFKGEGHLQVADAEGVVAGDGASWAVAWTTEAGKGESYVNLIPTPLGGTHEAGLRTGLFEALRDYCEHHALLPRGVTLQAEDVWSRAHFVLSANIVHTQFQGQTKDKLTSREVVRVVASVVKDPFMQWLLGNPESGKKIAELVIKQANARLRSGKVVEKRKSSGVATLPGKLTDCQITDITRNELFLVEGDSAGGGCKTARDRVYQAILPLRGKVLNTWEVARDQLFANNEVHDISVALGIDPHDADAPDSVLDGLRYGKVIILSDADVDGSHIQTLLLTLFFRHFPLLVARGHVFIAKPPLFRVDAPAKGKSKPAQKIYCLTEQERDDSVVQLQRDGFKLEQLTVSRFKGLGEMNSDQLKDTVLSPDTRLLLPVSVGDVKSVNRIFTLLMGKGESGARREWLETRGNEADIDV
ncbi:DNA topoisomerase IV subunit B [Burkholderia ubonensis]|uniref:DNA topoisomerase 4 subunit B n=1 Tax=Burkholderia ubonensis TaxID=101571 RepID=A0AAW3MTB4_9BURK|nr:DNA topoisomerase IV subunit B [Burkholderia ubonensis]KVP96859.1 DNA topoisomerase IV subunit B [Burkholderia ubonensis]KVP98206.1 DNA topoisomerase IV subunit B [Burkholderia ubonensis]KVZ92904.1 DNA topoisomerase IV subunit B [Burkholderia ubonensis]